jgi:hypothetical protein
MTLIACYLGYHANTVHGRRKVQHQFREKPTVQFSDRYSDRYDGTPRQIPWTRRLMGDAAVQAIYLHRYAGGITGEEEDLLKRTFPEAEVLEVYMIPAVNAE